MNRIPFALSFLCAGIAAQVTTTSPNGYLNQAGSESYLVGVENPGGFFSIDFARTYAQIDNTLVGAPRTIQAMHFRRSITAAADPTLTASTMTVSIRMAHADFAAITGESQPFSSLVSGPWTVVVPPTTVSIPDMSAVPASSPAPWAIRVPLATPFAYNGTDALIYEVLFYDNGVTPLYPLDAFDEASVASQGSAYGTGCMTSAGPYTAGGTIRVYAGNTPTEVEFRTDPALSQGFFSTNLNLIAVGTSATSIATGFCTPLQVDAVWTFPLSDIFSSGAGAWNGTTIEVPHDPAFVGIEFFAQGWGWESTNQGVLLGSQPWRTGPYPARPTGVPQVALSAGAAIGPGIGQFGSDGTFLLGRAIIVGIE